MKFNHHALFVLTDGLKEELPAAQSVRALEAAIAERGFEVQRAANAEAGLAYVQQSPRYSFIAIFWERTPESVAGCESLIQKIRERNNTVPIFLMSEHDTVEGIPVSILKEVNEYIYLYSETAAFTANRIYTAAHRYAEKLLPPYFNTLKNFTEDGDYYWDCPGHMGGMAYLKHPVGVEFINFFGENIMRADIGVATAEMGDYLVHSGPPKQSEDIAARLFGAEWTFYGVAGSSGSNRVVAQGAIGANEIAVVDRNCHKSLNHGLTLSQARPVYLTPSRNGYGLIGPIPAQRLRPESIAQLIKSSKLTADAVSPDPTYAVITNCTYDGFIYNVNQVVEQLSASVPRVHFDEAWYAYAKFHPIYRGRFAMDVADDMPNRPTLFAVHSTHKMLPAMSMASMIHVKTSERAPLSYDDFNDAFMMHGTTSPFYPIIASIDVSVAMMEGRAGLSLVQESIDEAVAFRQAVVKVKHELAELDGESSWFFDVLQPTEVKDPVSGKVHAFHQAPAELLSQDPSAWILRSEDSWHGFAKEDIDGADCMLDPVKVTITAPGITPQGEHEAHGIPGNIVSKFLDDRRIEVARTGDYTLLILFSVGTTKGKWGTLIESLLEFKKLYDNDVMAVDAIPSLKKVPAYASLTLKQLCQQMHDAMQELHLMKHSSDAVASAPEPVLTPAEAYQKVVRYQTERVKVSDFANRIAASMLVPYPPGIPVLMPGERLPAGDTGITGYLQALQEFDKRFPGFEHEIQGVNIDQNGDYWVRAIVEEDRKPIPTPSHVRFRSHKPSTSKKGRQ